MGLRVPDGSLFSGLTRRAARGRFRQRWVSPLLRRILLVNALPLALLVVALLYLDQYQNGLLGAQVAALGSAREADENQSTRHGRVCAPTPCTAEIRIR